MKASTILEAMGNDEELTATIFNALNHGMWDEWDCDLGYAWQNFDETEISIAAKTAAIIARQWGDHETRRIPPSDPDNLEKKRIL